jgi:hypothetical protein
MILAILKAYYINTGTLFCSSQDKNYNTLASGIVFFGIEDRNLPNDCQRTVVVLIV